MAGTARTKPTTTEAAAAIAIARASHDHLAKEISAKCVAPARLGFPHDHLRSAVTGCRGRAGPSAASPHGRQRRCRTHARTSSWSNCVPALKTNCSCQIGCALGVSFARVRCVCVAYDACRRSGRRRGGATQPRDAAAGDAGRCARARAGVGRRASANRRQRPLCSMASPRASWIVTTSRVSAGGGSAAGACRAARVHVAAADAKASGRAGVRRERSGA
jgi:hypothetical protein